MANHLETDTPADAATHESPGAGWLKVGLVAAASALAGGLAAAWFYRKTLTQLRQAEEHPADDRDAGGYEI